MRLVYVTSVRIPTEKAYGIQVMKMCEAFSGSGAVVKLVIPRVIGRDNGDPFVFYGVEPIFEIIRIPTPPLVNVFPKFGSWIQSLIFLIGAKLYLLTLKYDVLYIREKISAVMFRNFVMELHTVSEKLRYRDIKVLSKAKKIVVITNGLKKKLLDKGIPENNILVAPDGVDLHKFSNQKSKTECRAELGLPVEGKRYVYAGHLYPWKGRETMVETAKILGKTAAPFVIRGTFVGGTTADVKEFKEQIVEVEFQNDVPGYKPYSEIPKYLAAADVLVLPNSGKFEISRADTSPLKLFEYMAVKRAIVASDLPSIREILNERNAILVPPDDPVALAAGIEKAVADEQGSKNLAEQAFRDVQAYSWESRAKKILDSIK